MGNKSNKYVIILYKNFRQSFFWSESGCINW